ncbi:MAG: mevalonate-3-kinase [Thermoplasma acidophilum]|nr:mevalonate-3-kinase [Thermoplasma acidophilum]
MIGMTYRSIGSTAYPTIGVVLLGGIANPITRTPLHTSAGIAYSDSCGSIRSETKIYADEATHIYFNGTESTDDNRSVRRVLDRYSSVFEEAFGTKTVSYSSQNFGILSGSSDAGAASIGAAIMGLKPDLDPHDVENDLRAVSESAGRSLFGGLTITWSDGFHAYTEKVLDPDAFSGYSIVAFAFDYQRNPSDVIHQNIVKSDLYPARKKHADEHAHMIKEYAKTNDIKGIFELAQEDTEEYHSILRGVGVNVIRENMQKLIGYLKLIRKDYWNAYIVTGGSNVYVAVESENADKLFSIENTFGSKKKMLRIVGGAWHRRPE